MKKIIKNASRVVFLLLLIFSIFGVVNVLAEEAIFKITNISVKEKSDKVTVNDVSLSGGVITNDIVFTDKDDYITYDITIKNNTSDKYTIKSISDDNTSTYLDYTYDDLSNTELNAGDEKTFNLTITYIEETSNLTISNQAVSLTLTYEKDDGTTGSETISNSNDSTSITNPKTGDNITLYIILGLVSVTGLVITTVSKKHLSKSLMVVAVASSVLLPLGVKADSDKFIILFNNAIKEKEYTVTFNTNGGSSIDTVKVVKGGKVTRPTTDPTKDKKDFNNWYTTNELSTLFDFANISITKDTEIFAKWDDVINYTVVSGNINTLGSEVCIGNTECFYVLGKQDDNHVILFAKYNLNLGNGYDNSLIKQQSGNSHTIGFIDDDSHISDLFWEVNENWPYVDVNVYDEQSSLYPIVQQYTENLRQLGVSVTSRLMLGSDYILAGLDFSSDEEWIDIPSTAPSWLYSTAYWTGIGPWDNCISGVSGMQIHNENFASYDDEYGIRPVIILEIN